jgi:transitional endoplasmic reticulum ATPase
LNSRSFLTEEVCIRLLLLYESSTGASRGSFSRYLGYRDERGIREIFRKARQASPCVVFFDEIDSIAPVRGMEGMGYASTERMVSQLLTEMDGVQEIHDVVIIAATNRADMIDPALLRPGRFDRIVFISNPDKYTRKKILEINTKGKPIGQDVDLERIATVTEGFSGAEMVAIANTATSLVLHNYLQRFSTPEEALKHTSKAIVTMRHFDDAFRKVRNQKEMKPEGKMSLSHYG